MSRFGQHVPGISCPHEWELVSKDTREYKCAKTGCNARCTRTNNKLETYQNYPLDNK